MAGVGFRAVVTSLLFIIASLIPIMDSSSLDHNEPLFNSQNVTTEVRIHDINSESNDSEALIWYPNTPSNERIFQFTIMIDGITDPEDIDYCNLTMTWQYNVSSDNHLISVSLNKNNFVENEDGLILTYQYPYANNIFFGNYFISLDTIDTYGNNYSFSHQGIEVLERGYSISIIDNLPEDKLIFANGKLTELEFEIINIGVSYSNFDFLLTFETEMTAGWSDPLLYNDNLTSIWGGDSASISVSFDAPLDLISEPPPENLIFNLLISYEDDEGEIIELLNDSLTFNSIVVPEYSIPVISLFTDENRTELISDSLSTEPLDNSVSTTNGESIILFGNLTNYGFETSSFEMEIETIDSLNLWNISVFIDNKEVIPNQESVYSLATSLQPLENTSFRIEFNVSNSSFDFQDVSIKLTETTNLQDSETLLTFINYQINNPILFQNVTEQNSTLSIGDILQNNSFEVQVLFGLNSYFFTSGFENQWNLDVEMSNQIAILNSQNIFAYVVQNQTEELPIQFSINNKLPYNLIVALNEEIEIGNYSINLSLTQLASDEDNSLYFSKQINFNVLENSSLSVDNESQNNNSTNNSQDNNSTNNSQNNSVNNDTNLTNNTSVDDGNETLVDNNSTDISNPPQDNGTIIQNTDYDTNDSTKSNNDNSKSWIFMIIIIVVVGSIMVFIIQKRRRNNSIQTTSKEPININPILPQPIIQDLPLNQVTILRQWTDANGYTWRQMSDRSVLWWNGHDWVPVNQNQ
ncbi:MAG: hypothetical protein CBE08_006760 [Euryarchaeota archaeon TMED248]|nr:MAG: hypothetical protein CBE08_006760 [Euryarchaeota archaeon TMED248]